MPATLATPSPLEAMRLVVGIVKSAASLQRCLIGQIKLTRIHVLPVFLPGVRVKRDSGASLYNVERSANFSFAGSVGKLCLFALAHYVCFGIGDRRSTKRNWWSLTGSNRRHPACKAGALPAELRPHSLTEPVLVGPGRLELPTSRLSGVRSNHLSYGPPGRLASD